MQRCAVTQWPTRCLLLAKSLIGLNPMAAFFLCAGHAQNVRYLQRRICRWSVSVLILLVQCLVNNPSTLYWSCPWHTLSEQMAQSVVKVNVPAFSGPCRKLGGGNLLHLSGDVCFAGLWPCFSQFGSDHLRPSQLTWRPLHSAQQHMLWFKEVW